MRRPRRLVWLVRRSRPAVVAGLSLAVAVAAQGLTVPEAQATPAPIPAPAPVAAPATTAGATGDVVVDGYGDAQGYHLEVGRGEGGYAWSEVAVLQPGGLDVPSWTGYQCVSGDGRFAAVAVLPTSVVNLESARDRGAFAYSVDLASGQVRPVASGVGLMYFSPGCGVDDRAVFTLNLGNDQASTELVEADLASGKVARSVTLSGQVTSAVPSKAGITAAVASTLVDVPPSGQPTVRARAAGDVYDLRPAADGGTDFLSLAGKDGADAVHEVGGKLTTLAFGPRTRLALYQGRAGHAVLAGAATRVDAALAGAGVRAVDDGGLTVGSSASSLDGDALLGESGTGPGDQPLVRASRSGKVATAHHAGHTGTVTRSAAGYEPPGATAPVADAVPAGTPQPHGDAAPAATGSTPGRSPPAPGTGAPSSSAPTTPAPQKSPSAPGTTSPSRSSGGSAPTQLVPQATTSTTTTTTAQTPTCAVPRLAANRQVMQPSPAQVDWAAQMAEQGLLTGSYARPANFANLGLVAYAPSSDFPPIALSHPSSDTYASVPRSVYEAIMAQESNWSQASWHAPKGMAGDPLIADYYGAGGDIVSINYAGADCGYGLGQVTTGMRAGQTSPYSQHGQWKIAVDYQENMAAGLQILESTWNTLYGDGIIANDGNPRFLENWYFAAWAYNSGIQPNGSYNTTGCTPGPSCTGPDGTWGLGWSNNPDNPNYPPSRLPYLQATYADAAHPGSWPYQERVMGWMAHPLMRYSAPAYAGPTYHGGSTWLQIPGYTSLCTVAGNDCDPTKTNPTTPDAGHCQLGDYECWWHAPLSWVSSCSTTCATSSYAVTGGTEPANPSPNPPTCTIDTSKVPAGSIIVDDQGGSNLNLQGCSQSGLTTAGTFAYTYGTNANGDPIGAIDTHQLGAGLGGHILFSHTEDGSNPSLINTGTWTPTLPSLQYYKIKLHIPALGAQATNVVYTINPGGGVAPWKIRVNQAWNSEQWVTIGTFAMQNGGNVVLTNQSTTVNTTGQNYANYDVAFDAVAFVPMGGTPGAPIGGPPTIQDAPKGSNPAFIQCGCARRTAGDPVDTSTGYFGDTFTDLTTPGRGEPLAFTRSYAEAVADPAGPNGASAVNGPFGYGWTDSYNLSTTADASGNVTVTQEDGSRVAFTNNAGSYTTIEPRNDATLTASGSTYVYTRHGRDIFTFDTATGHLLAEQDLAGAKATPQYKTTLAYNGAGQLATVTDPAGRAYTLTWSGGHVTQLSDAAGRTVSYGYSAAGDLTDVWGVGTNRSGGTPGDQDHAVYAYNAAHLMASMRSPANFGGPSSAVTAMTYDSSERVLTQTDPDGRTTTFTYGPSSSPSLTAGQTLVTDPAGHQTLDSYSNGLLTSQTVGYGSSVAGTTSYTYDPLTLGISTAVDPTGATTTYTYDDHGNRTSASDALGYTTDYAYDGAGDLLETIDPTGLATVNGYDQAGHIATGSGTTNDGATTYGDLTSTTVTESNNIVESSTGNFGPAPTRTLNYYYDDAAHPGDRTRTVDPLNNTTTTAYDAAGDVTASTDPLGNKTLIGWDTARGWKTSTVAPTGTAAGTPVSCTAPAAGCTTYGHDAWGDTTATTDPLGHTTKAVFDADGRKTSVTDADGNTTGYAYDPAGQLTQVNQADGTHTTTSYNGDGTTAATTDAAGAVTSYTYDPRGRRITATDPDKRTTSTGYDADGRPTTVTDPAGATTTTAYDADGHATGISYSDGKTPNVTGLAYDPDGRRTAMTDGTGTSTWTYDVFGELTSQKNGAGATVGYGYDADGHTTSITYPGAAGTVTNGFNAGSQLTSVTDPSARKTTFGYNPDGANTTTSYPNGDTVTAGWNAADQQTSTTLTNATSTLGAVSYGRDNAGQLSAQTPSGSLPGPAQTYGYTKLQQVASASTGSTTSTYAYDPGNHLTTNGQATQGFDPAGQVCWATTAVTTATGCASTPAGATAYSYDGDGRRTTATPATGTSSSYTYNQANELTTATTPAGSGTYTYDGDGHRATKTVSGTTTAFTYGAPGLLSDGTTYIYGPGGLPIEQITGTTPSYYVHDQLGNTLALTDTTGAIAGTWTYDIYGKTTAHTGTATTPLQYGQGYTDTETGLIYLQARYYDPTTGQFLCTDPLVASTNSPYGYVHGNPLNALDPMGLCDWADTAGSFLGCLGGAIGDGFNAAGHWLSNNTVGLCVNGSYSLGGHATGSACAGFSGGHFFAATVGGGGLTTGLGASATVGLLLSNAHNPDELKGGFANVGGSVTDDEGEVAGDDFSWGKGDGGRFVWENQAQFGLGGWFTESFGGGLPGEGHADYTYTKVWKPCG